MTARILRPLTGSVAALALLALTATVSHAQDPLTTESERSGFTSYTSYDGMMEYLAALRASSEDMVLGSYGESWEGRTLPLAIFSRPRITEPWEAWTLGRPVVALNANVHGNERALRESLLLFVRDLATAGTETNALLDDVVILVAPQLNPDGFEATESGIRGNAWGIDMNRDWVKLEQPGLVAYATEVIGRWRPHIFVDGHSGGSLPYNLNYQCPSHAEPDVRITELCDQGIFPAIDARLEAEGYRSFWYARGNETRWNGGGYDARIGRNYGGFINTIGILFESPGRQELAPAVASGILGYQAVVEYARDNPELVIETVRRARVETIEMGRAARGGVVTAMEYGPEDFSVEYDIIVDPFENPRQVTVQSDSLMKKPIVTATRPRPFAYVLPRDATRAVDMLRRHGISVERLTEAVTLDVEAYVLTGVTYERAYNHAGAARVQIGDVVERSIEFPAGSFVVQTGQMLGRLVGHMLEPETNDNVIYWNTMDAWLPTSAIGADDPRFEPLVPIFKLMRERPLPAELIR